MSSENKKSDDEDTESDERVCLESQLSDTGPQKEEELECAVCLQSCVHPVQLPCSHIFCFLCVKGVANQSKRCAMCRKEIPVDFLDHPTLLNNIEEKETNAEGYQWFYGGRNGWWQYDERTSRELEAAYSAGQRSCEVLVAGFLYTIDFDRMMQQRRNDPSRRRRIKRDLSSIPKKGVAGLKTNSDEDDTTPVDTADESSAPIEASQNSQPISTSSQTSELNQVHLLHSDLRRAIDTMSPQRHDVVLPEDEIRYANPEDSHDSDISDDDNIDNLSNRIGDIRLNGAQFYSLDDAEEESGEEALFSGSAAEDYVYDARNPHSDY